MVAPTWNTDGWSRLITPARWACSSRRRLTPISPACDALNAPALGLAKHKGYPTAAHLAALAAHGVRDFHRRSFGPVKKLLAAGAAR